MPRQRMVVAYASHSGQRAICWPEQGNLVTVIDLGTRKVCDNALGPAVGCGRNRMDDRRDMAYTHRSNIYHLVSQELGPGSDIGSHRPEARRCLFAILLYKAA